MREFIRGFQGLNWIMEVTGKGAESADHIALHDLSYYVSD